jgi:hypothetical protein
MKQSRADSFMESLTNVAIGFGINFAANVLILPAVLGVPVHLAELGLIGLLYTVISVVRSYALRRAFNGRSVWQALTGRGGMSLDEMEHRGLEMFQQARRMRRGK